MSTFPYLFLFDINNLIKALELDPDLASLPHYHFPKIFQMLFICSGCDYLSYFHCQGKAAFLNAFSNMHNLSPENMQMAYCATSQKTREKRVSCPFSGSLGRFTLKSTFQQWYH